MRISSQVGGLRVYVHSAIADQTRPVVRGGHVY
jgi:hypothetical protein